MDISKTVRVYVSLPTDEDPTPAFVLHNLSDASTFVRIERTVTGPGRAAIVGMSYNTILHQFINAQTQKYLYDNRRETVVFGENRAWIRHFGFNYFISRFVDLFIYIVFCLFCVYMCVCMFGENRNISGDCQRC